MSDFLFVKVSDVSACTMSYSSILRLISTVAIKKALSHFSRLYFKEITSHISSLTNICERRTLYNKMINPVYWFLFKNFKFKLATCAFVNFAVIENTFLYAVVSNFISLL